MTGTLFFAGATLLYTAGTRVFYESTNIPGPYWVKLALITGSALVATQFAIDFCYRVKNIS